MDNDSDEELVDDDDDDNDDEDDEDDDTQNDIESGNFTVNNYISNNCNINHADNVTKQETIDLEGLDFNLKLNKLSLNEEENKLNELDESLNSSLDTQEPYDLYENDEFECFSFVQSYWESLNLNVGENRVARYSCAAHKLNLCVRKSVRESLKLNKLIRKLSILAHSTNKSVKWKTMYGDKRCKLVCDNSTRWGSTFIMLSSFINARNRGIEFDSQVKFKDVEVFTQILLPVYRLNLLFQCNDSNIGIVIPILLHTIHENLEALNLKKILSMISLEIG